ncbi:MAG: TIGR00270 family protein [Candidatus Diapherotrites archaeon]|uniref:TIGR00270 family protein n=1 Tax=Candidatus Iainarchaeum sp. TaxID=3101447 RepID=A0A7J4KSC9_9ARCH|nr:TIGR00270 family protein [Candidatus Diapherotrites archaeon]HIH21599.1 TIGR00270 family protein [Candidatus Diapherotrites archaeon]HIH32792.1 TIGR00270 family protein [Candidatus Diapherotrites archaeon]
MNCELCGKPAFEKTFVEIDGAVLLACDECSTLGSIVQEPRAESQKMRKAFIQKKPFLPSRELDEGLSLKADYGSAVRNKRQALGLTLEELAKKMFEKESVLQKIESQKLIPSEQLVAKLEKALQLSLRENSRE